MSSTKGVPIMRAIVKALKLAAKVIRRGPQECCRELLDRLKANLLNPLGRERPSGTEAKLMVENHLREADEISAELELLLPLCSRQFQREADKEIKDMRPSETTAVVK